MRVVLRDSKTGLYLTESETWTEELEHAHCFRHSAEAMDLARSSNLLGLEVLLAFEDPPRYVVLPLPRPRGPRLGKTGS